MKHNYFEQKHSSKISIFPAKHMLNRQKKFDLFLRKQLHFCVYNTHKIIKFPTYNIPFISKMKQKILANT